MPWIMGFLSADVVWFLFFRNGDASVGDLIGIAVLTVLCTYVWAAIDNSYRVYGSIHQEKIISKVGWASFCCPRG
jgi:hypothetical protein